MAIRDYRDLIAWQRSLDFIEEIYRLTRRFPREERFGLTSQLCRSAVSVSSNIAEGSGRATTRDLLNFLSHSRGSVKEAESLVYVAQRLEFVRKSDCSRSLELAEEVAKILAGLRASVAKGNRRPTRN